jgi:hypothetical protein
MIGFMLLVVSGMGLVIAAGFTVAHLLKRRDSRRRLRGSAAREARARKNRQ